MKEKTSYLIVLLIILIIGFLFMQWRDCDNSGGVLMRPVFGFVECIYK